MSLMLTDVQQVDVDVVANVGAVLLLTEPGKVTGHLLGRRSEQTENIILHTPSSY